MPPIGTETSHVAPSPTGSDVVGEEVAAPITNTPSPSVTPSPPPPPQAVRRPQHQDEPYLRELHPFVPFAPYPGNPSDSLPLNTNLVSVLKQVSGKEDLNEVYDLRLRVIAQEMSLQRLCYLVPNLRELSLDGSRLISLRDLGCGLMNLEVLKVARCGLDSLDGLFGLMSLKELHAGGNQIDDVSPCSVLPNIALIDVRANNVSDVSFLGFLAICTDLRHLVLAENPAAHVPGYRDEVRRLLPGLVSLDGEPFDADEDNDDSSLETDDLDDDDFGGGGLDDWLRGDAPDTSTSRDTFQGVDSAASLDDLPGGGKGAGSSANQDLGLELSKATTVPRCKSSVDIHIDSAGCKPVLRGVRCLSARSPASLSTDFSAGGDSPSNTDFGKDVPSKMTSGPPLCGNLAQRRNRKACLSTALQSHATTGAAADGTGSLTTINAAKNSPRKRKGPNKGDFDRAEDLAAAKTLSALPAVSPPQ